MANTEPPATHFLEHFFSGMRTRANQPLLFERQGAVFMSVTHRETAVRIADFTRALSATTLAPGDRVALYAAASPALLIAEWAVLASRGVAVIVPRSFSSEDLIETLIESKSRLVIIDRLATGYHLANAAAALPDLQHIICFEGGAEAPLPIWSWGDFIDSGRTQPDRASSLLRAIADKDTALLFYYKGTGGARRATRYTHALLLDHVSRIETMLGAAAIRKDELVLTATAWEHAVGHIASCYVPVLKEALVQITHGIANVTLFENCPHVTVGDATFFDGVRQNIIQWVHQSGRVESSMLKKALALSKQSYESPRSLGLLARIQKAALKATIVNKIQRALGGRLRLFIGTDNEAHYETQLFFHTFGIEFIELPQEAFR